MTESLTAQIHTAMLARGLPVEGEEAERLGQLFFVISGEMSAFVASLQRTSLVLSGYRIVIRSPLPRISKQSRLFLQVKACRRGKYHVRAHPKGARI